VNFDEALADAPHAPGSGVDGPRDGRGDAQGGAKPHRPGQPADDPTSRGRYRRDRPLGGQGAGTGDDPFIGRTLLGAEEAEDGTERRASDAAAAQPFGVEPVLVELEPLWQLIGQRLVQAGGEQTPRMLLCHDRRMDLTSIAAAVVAGGLARRFDGQDKSRLIVEGRTIITRQVDILQQVAATVLIVANDAGRFADLGLPVFADRVAGAGAVGGIDTALHATTADRVIVVACDLPFLHAGVLRRLVELAGEGDGAWVRTPRGVEPLLACYRRRARGRVRAEIDAGRLKAGGLGSVLSMAELGIEELAAFGAPDRLLANINTPSDYARVQ